MFDPNQAILEWRRQMLAADIKSPVPLDELETHLRDEIEQQAEAGLSEEAAFQAAVKNLGTAPVLQPEFKKVEGKKTIGWSKERAEILDQIALAVTPYVLTLVLVSPVGLLFFKGGEPALKPTTFGQQESCLAAIATALLFLWGGRLGYRLFPVIPAKRTRDAIQYSVLALMALWWVLFFNTVLPWCQDNGLALLVVIMWGFMAPVGPCIGLSLGIETAARKKVPLAGM
jgi:hypothetical protein